MGLVRLDPREVGTFTLREAVLAVELELSGDNGVLAPAVHIQRGFREDECASIRDTRVFKVRSSVGVGKTSDDRGGKTSSVQRNLRAAKVGLVVRVGGTVPVSSPVLGEIRIDGASVLEETLGINVSTGISSN